VHHGYTSDTLGIATADAKNKGGVAVEEPEEDPVPNQWVAFSAEASPLDRVSAWVNSLGDASFHAVDENDATGQASRVGFGAGAGEDEARARPRVWRRRDAGSQVMGRGRGMSDLLDLKNWRAWRSWRSRGGLGRGEAGELGVDGALGGERRGRHPRAGEENRSRRWR
jgi:hypothetical protein